MTKKKNEEEITWATPIVFGDEPNKNGDIFPRKVYKIEPVSEDVKKQMEKIKEYMRDSFSNNFVGEEDVKQQILERCKNIEIPPNFLNVSISCEVDKEDPRRLNMTIGGTKKDVKKIIGPHCRGVELKDTEDWQKVGKISVDAGICWLGDPCYILPDKRGDVINEQGLLYTDMLNARPYMDASTKDNEDIPQIKNYDVHAFDHYPGNSGKGMLVSSGFGDGFYDVFVKTKEIKDWGRRITEMKVVFIEENE